VYKFKTNFLFLFLILLTFSCSAHKEIPYQEEPPPQARSDFKNELSNKRKTIVQQAIKSVGVPYKWGGRSPKTGFDCSGLIAYTHQKANITMPRTAQEIFNKGKIVSKKHIQAADLVFFKSPKATSVFHVGIYVGKGSFVHAPGKGRKVGYGNLRNPYFKKHYIGSRSYL